MSLIAPPCRICGSGNTAYMRDVQLRLVNAVVPLWYCLDCESFTHPRVYTESDAALKRDADWQVTVEPRNVRWSENLFNALSARSEGAIESVLEIGCATGSLLSVAKRRGMSVLGFDTNPHARKLAQERHGIETRVDIWNARSTDERFDLVVCVSVMEHILDPRELMMQIGEYCTKHGSRAYVSVPLISERSQWSSFLREPEPKDSTNPLYLADVHINHFSRKALEEMAWNSGAKSVERFPYGWLHSYLIDYRPRRTDGLTSAEVAA